VADANRYFAGEAPWALAKTDPARQGTVLYVTAEVIRQVAILALPFMPTSAAKFLDLLNIPETGRDFAALGSGHRLAPGTTLGAIKPVFPRYVEPLAPASEVDNVPKPVTGEIDDDERTNALGLFNTARSYWRSAEHLNAARLKLTHPSAPVTFLFCHGIELYLKAYLRAGSHNVAQLKQVGHKLANLARASSKAGLSLPPEQSAILSHLDKADVAIEARYLVTGFKSLPTNEALSSLAEHLDQTVFAALEKQGLPVRPQNFDPPTPQPQHKELDPETARALVYLFVTEEPRQLDPGAMSKTLGLQRNVLQYRLDQLKAAGLAEVSGGNPIHGYVYWVPTAEGRQYVVEHKLVES
jgi:hypothetical protein